MADLKKIKLGSRWALKDGRIFTVIEKKPFGKVSLMQEGRAYFTDTTQKALRENWKAIEGEGYYIKFDG